MKTYRCTYNQTNKTVTAGKINTDKKQRERKSEYNLNSKTNRRNNKYRYIIESLEEKPTYFITLNCETDDIDLAIKRFNQFTTRVREKFKDCWFIWKMDCNHHIFHYHIIGSFNENKPSVDYSDWIYQRWNKVWSGIKKNSVDVQRIGDGPDESSKVKNYLLKKERRDSEMALNNILGKRYSFGYINTKNVQLSKTVSVIVDEKKLYELKKLIIEDIETQIMNPREKMSKTHNIMKQNYLNHRFYNDRLHKKYIKKLNS